MGSKKDGRYIAPPMKFFTICVRTAFRLVISLAILMGLVPAATWHLAIVLPAAGYLIVRNYQEKRPPDAEPPILSASLATVLRLFMGIRVISLLVIHAALAWRMGLWP